MPREFKLRINRDDFVKFLPNQRTIRAFENLFEVSSTFVSSHLFDCDSDLDEADVVYIDSSNHIAKANASGLSTAKVIGIVGFKPTSTTCEVISNGEATGFEGLSVGDPYFLSELDGEITDVPVQGADKVNLKIGYALTESSLWVNIDNIIIRS